MNQQARSIVAAIRMPTRMQSKITQRARPMDPRMKTNKRTKWNDDHGNEIKDETNDNSHNEIIN